MWLFKIELNNFLDGKENLLYPQLWPPRIMPNNWDNYHLASVAIKVRIVSVCIWDIDIFNHSLSRNIWTPRLQGMQDRL